MISQAGTVATVDSAEFEPVKGKQTVSKEDKATLRALLVTWREERHFRMGNSPYIPAECVLPPKQLEKLVAAASTFLKHSLVEAKHIKKAIAWELASATDIAEVCQVISGWRLTLEISRTPQSARRQRKQPRITPAIPLTPQPIFTPMPPRSARPPLAAPASSSGSRVQPVYPRTTSTRQTPSNRQNPPPSFPIYSPAATNAFPHTPQTPTVQFRSNRQGVTYDDFFASIHSSASRYSTPGAGSSRNTS
ncbi:hypothetical protein B0H14DRAFT_2935254 [Mycena olivaceomarginata]|nr:hypothetical protein B0H14DRAFT_2935254 [Mycena olivaceomarginata]